MRAITPAHTMIPAPWRHIVPLIAALLLGGCRDRYLSTAYENESPGSARILYTDLDRMVVVSMTMAGEGTDVVPRVAQDELSGTGPLLSSPPRRGLMPIMRRGSDFLIHTMHRLDGTIPDYLSRITVSPEEFIDGSFVLSDDAGLYAMFLSGTDSTSSPATYLHTGTLAEGFTHAARVGDIEHITFSCPRFSPDGAHIALLDLWGDSFVELVMMDVDGGSRIVWSGARESTDNMMSPRLEWSPDGKTIAIAGIWMSQAIVLVDPKTTMMNFLSTAPFHRPRGLSWSPDGKSMVFSATVGSNEEVCTIEVATGTIRNITGTETEKEFAPQWSPDGRRIAYVIERGGRGAGSPAIYDLDRGTSRTYPGRTSGVFWAR
jgi:hypothetical protein